MNLSWIIKPFSDLSLDDLYSILRLRQAVFVVEQNCPYQDADGKDQKAFHIMGLNEKNELEAYARVIPAGLSFAEVSIGRVITCKQARGSGSGKELMRQCLKFIEKTYGKVPVRIGAQCYLIKFYSALGFEIVSEEYLEDNIPHVEMLHR
jgi:ElaA protein